jgi:bacterial mobilization protein
MRNQPTGCFLVSTCWCVAPNPIGYAGVKERKDGVFQMAKRERTVMLRLMVTEEEADMIRQKMLQVGTTNFSMYARKMLIDGYVIKRDFSELKALTKELSNLARNINQIALRANETRSIYQQDIDDLKQYYGNVKRACTERLVKMIEE